MCLCCARARALQNHTSTRSASWLHAAGSSVWKENVPQPSFIHPLPLTGFARQPGRRRGGCCALGRVRHAARWKVPEGCAAGAQHAQQEGAEWKKGPRRQRSACSSSTSRPDATRGGSSQPCAWLRIMVSRLR